MSDVEKTPSPGAMAMANHLLSVPILMGEITGVIQRMAERINTLADQLDTLTKLLIEKQPPRTFFLNEMHETHVTKAQARKEQRLRREAKKVRQGKSKSSQSSPAPRRRKSGSGSGRR